MKEINLYRNKGTVLVDDADFEWLSQYRWHLDHGYAAMTIRKPKKGVLYMHRLINQTSIGLSTDHINGNKLDNRRGNLRSCSQSQNNANQTVRYNKSGFKGVVWHRRNQKWQAQIGINGKCKYLGQYKDKLEAAKAYDTAAKALFGEFAYVNL